MSHTSQPSASISARDMGKNGATAARADRLGTVANKLVGELIGYGLYRNWPLSAGGADFHCRISAKKTFYFQLLGVRLFGAMRSSGAHFDREATDPDSAMLKSPYSPKSHPAHARPAPASDASQQTWPTIPGCVRPGRRWSILPGRPVVPAPRAWPAAAGCRRRVSAANHAILHRRGRRSRCSSAAVVTIP